MKKISINNLTFYSVDVLIVGLKLNLYLCLHKITENQTFHTFRHTHPRQFEFNIK